MPARLRERARLRWREEIGVGGKHRVILGEHAFERQNRLLGREAPVGNGVKGGDRARERTHRRNLETPLDGHAVIEVRLIESAHAERPFDHLSRAPKQQKPVGREGYGHEIEIEIRRRPSIDAKLVLTGLVPDAPK